MLFYKDNIRLYQYLRAIAVLLTLCILCTADSSAQDAPAVSCSDLTSEYVEQIRRQKNEIDKLRAELAQAKKQNELELTELHRRASLLQSALDLAVSSPEERQKLLKQIEAGNNDNNPRFINLMMKLHKAEEDLKMQILINAEKTKELVHLRKELREKDKECSVAEIIEKNDSNCSVETAEELNREIEELEAENQELNQQIEILRGMVKKQQEELELLRIKD